MTLDNDQALAKHKPCSSQTQSSVEYKNNWVKYDGLGAVVKLNHLMLFFHLPLLESGSLPQWDHRCGCCIGWRCQAGFRRNTSGACRRTAEHTSKASEGMAGAHHQQCWALAQPHSTSPPAFGFSGEKQHFLCGHKTPQLVLIWCDLLTGFLLIPF